MYCCFTCIVTGILFSVQTAKSCSYTPQDAQLIPTKINDSVQLVCQQFCEIPGHVFEHYNQSGYYVIARSHKINLTINDMDDGGSYRCYQSGCNNDCYMYFTILVHPSVIHLSPNTEHTNDIATCSAFGNPAPVLQAGLLPPDCHYTTSYNVSQYKGQVAVIIPDFEVMEECRNVTVYCNVMTCDSSNTCPPVATMRLHTSIRFHQTNTTTQYPQSTEYPRPTVVSTSPPPKNGTSSVDITSNITTLLLFLIMIAFLIVQ